LRVTGVFAGIGSGINGCFARLGCTSEQSNGLDYRDGSCQTGTPGRESLILALE
jgi:hypothetical protein